LLIPALVATGGSGFAFAKGRTWAGLVGAKIKRMPFIAVNGILVLIPSALFLASKARAAEFDTTFYVVQALELAAGAGNITLLGLNMRDGLKMKGRPCPSPTQCFCSDIRRTTMSAPPCLRASCSPSE
jgi:hypothetical protein